MDEMIVDCMVWDQMRVNFIKEFDLKYKKYDFSQFKIICRDFSLMDIWSHVGKTVSFTWYKSRLIAQYFGSTSGGRERERRRDRALSRMFEVLISFAIRII